MLRVKEPRKPRPAKLSLAEQQSIVAACEGFIETVLKPRFLPAIRPTEYNYPINIHGDWRAGRYRFMQRFRSGMQHNAGFEFDAPFTRIDYKGPDKFDVYWMRHTGQWWQLYWGLTLDEAFRMILEDPNLHPL